MNLRYHIKHSGKRNNKRKISFGLVGCGRIGQIYKEVILSNPVCQLKGIADINGPVTDAVSRRHNFVYCHDYRELLNGGGIDCVVVATPPNTHFKISTFFLKNGVNVLCEKPLTTDLEAAQKLIETANMKGCLLMMASKFRYVEGMIKAKEIIETGVLGKIARFENVFCSRVDMNNRWNSKKEIAGGGVLIDNGSHSVDIVQYLLGPILKVQAQEGIRVQNLEVEETVKLNFKTQPNVLGTIELSWSIHKDTPNYVNVFGMHGVLHVGWKTTKYKQFEKSGWTYFEKAYDKMIAIERQLQNFVDVIRGKDSPLITDLEALNSIRVIETAYRAMALNKWVAVKSDENSA